jgi:hypothetical protein
MPRSETPADVLDTYAFDFGFEYFDDFDCPCCSFWEWDEDEVEKLCAEDAPEPSSTFANRPRRRV